MQPETLILGLRMFRGARPDAKISLAAKRERRWGASAER